MKKTLLNLGVLFFTLFLFNYSHAQVGLDFDGSDDYIQTSYPGVLGTNARTFEAWVYITAVPSSNITILDYGTSAAGSRNTLIIDPSAKLNFLSGGTNGNLSSPANSVTVGQWVHAAFVIDNGVGYTYVDGVQVATGNLSGVNTPSGGDNLKIGQRVTGGNIPFNGIIDEVRVWDVARTQAEIQADMNAELCPSTANLVAYYKLNDGVADGSNTALTMVSDSSGNGNDGVLNNFALTGTSSNFVTGATLSATTGGYDNTLTVTSSTLTANQTGATYQWVDCDNANSPISGETGQSFTPTIEGNYAVEITEGTCVYMSSCVAMTICSVPSNLLYSNVDHESAELIWVENGTSIDWELMYGVSGFNPDAATGTSVLVSGTAQYILTGLTNNTTYDVYVRSICDVDFESNWSNFVTFTTLDQDPCPEVTGLAANNITDNSVDLSWIENGTSGTWIVKYGGVGFDPNTSGQQITDNDGVPGVSIVSLQSETTYEFRVRSYCGAGEASDWSDAETFTTTEVLSVENEILNNIELYPNPANNVINLKSNVLMDELVVYNMLGQKMMTYVPSKENVSVDISGLQSGIFFVKAKLNNNYKTFKVIKE